MTGGHHDGPLAPGARAWGEPSPGAADWTDGLAARLRPASRASRAPRTQASRLLRTTGNRLRPASAAFPDGVRVVEDHHLDPAARARAWHELVGWVIWLHDAYELSVEERLPECWPAHPGLVAELAALKAWRIEIYQPPADPAGPDAATPTTGNGGPARAWHTELRNVLTAAATVYAPGCRVGHRPAPRQLTGDPDLRATWLAQAPALLAPHGVAPPGDSPDDSATGPLVISGTAMDDALRHGHARRLGPGLPGYAHQDGSWWAHAPDGTWLTVTDPALTARLDQAATAIDRAQAAADTGESAR